MQLVLWYTPCSTFGVVCQAITSNGKLVNEFEELEMSKSPSRKFGSSNDAVEEDD